MTRFIRFLAASAAAAVLMVAAAGAPALAQDQGMADDSACVMAGLLGEEFGLCNAYCEAMDCDGDTPQASAKACEKVRAKFEAIDGAPELPCLAVEPVADTCPCEAFAGGGGEVAGMIGQAAGDFLRTWCTRSEVDHAACLDSMRCEVHIDTRAGGGGFLIFLTGTDPFDVFHQLMNWSYAASRDGVPGAKVCFAQVLHTFPAGVLDITLLRDIRREDWKLPSEKHLPFLNSEIDDCVATLVATAGRIEAAIGRFVGKEDFTCTVF